MVRTKVFVGNLSFSTKENELAKEFEVAGKVISANIITRGPRSLGYGFVEMDSEGDAENAVKMLDKKEIDGRPINVEVAKPREEGADAAQAANAQGSTKTDSGRGRRGRGGRGGSRGGANRGDDNRGPRTEDNRGSRDDNRGPRDDNRGPRGDNNSGANQSGDRRPRGGRGGRGGNAQGSQRGGQQPYLRKSDAQGNEADASANRTPSTTTLFVANLPFEVDDDAFAKVIKDASLAYKTAHVVKKKTGRSKGFGFIEFDNEADQQKALAALNNLEVKERRLAVKVALTEIRSTDNASSSPAPSNAASSPAPSQTATPSTKSSSPAPAKNAAPAAQGEKKEGSSTPAEEKK